jgi:hypothetical protein
MANENIIADETVEPEVNYIGAVNEILNDPKIKEILEHNPEIENSVESAAEILIEEPHALAAIKESIRGIINNKIDVFFSYKSKDEKTARKVVEQLRVFAGDKLRIIYAADFPEDAGTNWNKKIRESIRKAHWFILLLPDPSVDWDWCLFETGMFRGKMVSDKVNRLFCLHHPDVQPPPQIKEFQAIKAEVDTVQSFLKMVYLDKDPIPGMDPINPYITTDLLEGIAKTIANAISPPMPLLKRSHFERYAMLKIENPGQINCPDDLNSATILDTDDLTLNLFGKRRVPETWGKLVENVVEPECENKWLMELCASIKKAATNTIFKPIQATFENYGRGKNYLPMLYAMDERTDGSIEDFKILFVEEVSARIYNKHIPKSIQALMTGLRLAYRFRWELLERFKNIEMTNEHIQQFKDILERIENEGRSRGLLDPSKLYANFNQEESNQIVDIYKEWWELKNDRNDGELDIAIENEDGIKIQQLLPTMAGINHRFLNLAARRLQELS